jgi:hypothetical protein
MLRDISPRLVPCCLRPPHRPLWVRGLAAFRCEPLLGLGRWWRLLGGRRGVRRGDGDGLRWGGQLPVLIGLVRMREEELMCVCRACACGFDVGLCGL